MEENPGIMMQWIRCKDQEPEWQQEVAFIVNSSNSWYNKRRMGGRYLGKKETISGDGYYYEFSVPGHSWAGSHWMPLPELPKDLTEPTNGV